MKCVDIYIFQVGKNVLYPFKYMEKAYELGVKGIAMEKGIDLFIEAEAEEDILKKYITWCKTTQFTLDPHEEYVEVVEATPKNYTSFEVLEKGSEIPIEIKDIEKGFTFEL